MTVEALMNGPVQVCRPSAPLTEAIKIMVENGLNAVAAADDHGALVGILTDHDIMRALHAGGGQLGGASISDWMTRDVVTCRRETKLADALRTMARHGIRHLVVTDRKKPLAVIGIRKILTKMHEDDELEISVLRDLANAALINSVA